MRAGTQEHPTYEPLISPAMLAEVPLAGLSFGGYRLSGIGSKAGGPEYLLQFTVPRTVTENMLRRGFAPESGPTAG